MLLAVAAVGFGFQSGFAVTDFMAIPLLLVPSLLGWWGVKLFFRLYAGFLPRARRLLFWFYSAVVAYCGMWLVSTFSRDGMSGAIFAPQEQLFGLLLLLTPLLVVGFMKPDEESTSAAKNEEAEQVAS
jgi:hypothetical protein